VGLVASMWDVGEAEDFLPRLANLFERRTGLSAVVVSGGSGSPDRALLPVGSAGPREFRVPRLHEGFALDDASDQPRTLVALWHGFPPNPYCYHHVQAAAVDLGAIPRHPHHFPPRYRAAWRDLSLPRRLVLSTRLLQFLW
jgi:hypothetical protein